MVKHRKERVEVTKRMITAMKMMKLQKKKNYFIASVLNVSPTTVSRYTNKKRVDMTLKKRVGRTTGSSTGLNNPIPDFIQDEPEKPSMIESISVGLWQWVLFPCFVVFAIAITVIAVFYAIVIIGAVFHVRLFQ